MMLYRELHPERYEHAEPPLTSSLGASSKLTKRTSPTGAQLLLGTTPTSAAGASSKRETSAAPLVRAGSLQSLGMSSARKDSGGGGDGLMDSAAWTGGGPPMLARLQSVTMSSSKLVHQDSSVSLLSIGSAGSLVSGAAASQLSVPTVSTTIRPVSTPKTPSYGAGRRGAGGEEKKKKKSNAMYLSTYKKPGGESGLSPEAAAEARRRKMNRQPCSLAYSAEGQLVVGFKSGGVLVYASYEVYPVGDLRHLQVVVI